jgi:hypothetical protein
MSLMAAFGAPATETTPGPDPRADAESRLTSPVP